MIGTPGVGLLRGQRRGSISEQLAEGTNTSVAEVHTRLILPFLTVPGFSGDFQKAVIADYQVLARAGDVESLDEILVLLEGVEERSSTLLEASIAVEPPFAGLPPKGGSPAAAMGRGVLLEQQNRLNKSVTALKRSAEIARRMAVVIREEP